MIKKSVREKKVNLRGQTAYFTGGVNDYNVLNCDPNSLTHDGIFEGGMFISDRVLRQSLNAFHGKETSELVTWDLIRTSRKVGGRGGNFNDLSDTDIRVKEAVINSGLDIDYLNILYKVYLSNCYSIFRNKRKNEVERYHYTIFAVRLVLANLTHYLTDLEFDKEVLEDIKYFMEVQRGNNNILAGHHLQINMSAIGKRVKETTGMTRHQYSEKKCIFLPGQILADSIKEVSNV